MMIKIGDYGTAYDPGKLRVAVKIVNIKEGILHGQLLSSPDDIVWFPVSCFIPRGNRGEMMLLEQQIQNFEQSIERK